MSHLHDSPSSLLLLSMSNTGWLVVGDEDVTFISWDWRWCLDVVFVQDLKCTAGIFTVVDGVYASAAPVLPLNGKVLGDARKRWNNETAETMYIQ